LVDILARQLNFWKRPEKAFTSSSFARLIVSFCSKKTSSLAGVIAQNVGLVMISDGQLVAEQRIQWSQ
jgi:hypothetical protein